MFLITSFYAIPLFGQENSVQIEDSLLKRFSIEDLVQIKKLLEAERSRLISQQEKDRQRGVDVSKEFLTQTREENANQDIILIRVAEYYIEEADRALDKEVEEYNKNYQEYEKEYADFRAGKLEVEPVQPKFPIKDYRKAIEIYDLILTNFPDSELADDALYNKGFLLGDMGREEEANDVYLEMIDKFPESEFMPEAYMQMAEYFFQPKLGQGREETIRNLNQAIQLYKNVLKYKDSPRYDEALYKLGWTYYRLAAADPAYYNDAILYFTSVIQDIEKLKDVDPSGKYVKTNIQPEALQYLAASFIDTTFTQDGIQKAKTFLTRLGSPEYGIDILSNMGDIYGRIVNYDNSIRAYQNLLEMYPDYERSPLIRKKIADIYLEAQQIERAYNERNTLFDDYNPKTEWYADLEKKEIEDRIFVLDEASELTEEAIRSNIIYQLAAAQEAEENKGDSLAAYREFTELAKKYLETFPTHENAYEINWSLAYVLDTELHQSRDAFEEYLKVSNDYLEEGHREDAANNAIVIAQALVNPRMVGKDTTQISGMDLSQLTAQELNEEEELLAEAYDNYIKLFPDQEKTASYLANAGALYYQHRQYDLARKYYKTMVTKFPESHQKSIGLLSLMNSYFFLGKYLDAEFVAKKIVESEGIPEDQIEIARRRIGESIYKNGERLEQEENYLAAAQEFFRVYEEAPYYDDIVDISLFNSARNYEKANEWNQAINTYDVLISNYENSEYRLVSLGRVADAYKQIEDFSGVGRTYERIYTLYPNSDDAEAALFNASLFYAQANNWDDAIRVNNRYIENFPNSADSKDLLFENARYYLKLEDIENANRIYDDFARRYPDDKRTIEAYFRRGEYYYEQNQVNMAKQEFSKAINKSAEYARTGRDPNSLYASEAYFKLGEIEYDEFKSMKLRSNDPRFRESLNTKQSKLLSVVNAFTEVIRMGSLKGFEAMYKVAEAYETMADDIADQEMSPNLSPDERLVERDRIFKASIPAYDRAVEEYKNVINNIPVLAQELEITLEETDQTSAVETPVLEDSLIEIRKETIQDSTREVALKWNQRAEDKVSSLLYKVAEQSSEFIDAYLRQENPATGMVYLSWKKLLLERAVKPAVNVTLSAHLKNINISEQLNLENKYSTESKRKVLLVSDIIADEYGKLVKNSEQTYREQIPVLNDLVRGGENATTPDGKNSMDYNDQMLNTIDYMNEFLTSAINQYKNTLYFANENQINNDAVLTSQDRMLGLAYESGNLLLSLSALAAQNRDEFSALSDSSGEPKYQLGIIYFDDQRSILQDYARNALVTSYDVAKDLEINNLWTNLILAKLVELDPGKYLGDVPKQVNTVSTDQSWLVSSEYFMDWVDNNCDDSQWEKADMVELPLGVNYAGSNALQSNAYSIWKVKKTSTDSSLSTITSDSTTSMPSLTTPVDSNLTTTNSSMSDIPDSSQGRRSLELEDKETLENAFGNLSESAEAPESLGSALSPVEIEPDTVTLYFRKHFNLPDRTINGFAFITADDGYHLYLNGQYIKEGFTDNLQTADRIEYIEFSDFLRSGDNVIAIDVTDYDGPPRNGLRLFLELELLPAEIASAAERIRQQAEESVDPQRLKIVSILNKNRVLSQ
jgi:tetratricopeptide (TPR) repeat protein